VSPDLAVARHYLGSRRFDLAERHLRLFLASEPDSALGHGLLVDCLIARQALPEAHAEARESIRLAPDACLGHAALAAADSAAHQWRAAERSINEAIRLDPRDPHHWATLAHALTEQGRAKRAMKAADEGLRLRPTDSGCLNERALALLDLGHLDAARATIRSALVSQPESAVLHSNLAYVLLGYGETSAAREEALEALRLNPTLKVAQANLRAAQRGDRGPLTQVLVRATSWWRHRPIWERLVFIGGLAVTGVFAPVAWIMAVSIGGYWSIMATRRVLANPANRFHRFGPLVGMLTVPALFVGVVVAEAWPRQAPGLALFAGFTATFTLALAAAFAQPRRTALFGLTLALVAVGSFNQSWLPSGVGAPNLDEPSLGALDLTDEQVLDCLLSAKPPLNFPATGLGINMYVERGMILQAVPPPSPFPTDPNDPALTEWVTTVTGLARENQDIMIGCVLNLAASPS
jgi:tetratricopeptide (TPR) repeat protein